jgi:hypothetical protein
MYIERLGTPVNPGSLESSGSSPSTATRSRRSRLIEYPRRRCGWFVPSRHPDVWLTNRLPAVRGLASERGASVRVSPWCGSKEARAPTLKSDMPTVVSTSVDEREQR